MGDYDKNRQWRSYTPPGEKSYNQFGQEQQKTYYNPGGGQQSGGGGSGVGGGGCGGGLCSLIFMLLLFSVYYISEHNKELWKFALNIVNLVKNLFS